MISTLATFYGEAKQLAVQLPDYFPPGQEALALKTPEGMVVETADAAALETTEEIYYKANTNTFKSHCAPSFKGIDELVKKARLGEESSGRTKQYEIDRGQKEAIQDFHSLDLENIRDISSNDEFKKIGTIQDGSKVIIRKTSKKGRYYDGLPVLEVQSGKKKIKFRYIS